MKLSVTSNTISNIAEIWTLGDHALMVKTKTNKLFKITAARNIYSGSSYKYLAFYEEQTAIEWQGETKTIWVTVPLSSPGGNTIEHCLEIALQYINDVIK